jgi:hypothetical protein
MIKGKTLNNQQSMFNVHDDPELATGNSQLLTRFSLFLPRDLREINNVNKQVKPSPKGRHKHQSLKLPVIVFHLF